MYSVVSYFTGDGWFIGATDKAVDGEYVWMNGKTKLSQIFHNWVPRSMDNHYKDEACLGLYRYVGYSWADVTCEAKLHYICEM